MGAIYEQGAARENFISGRNITRWVMYWFSALQSRTFQELERRTRLQDYSQQIIVNLSFQLEKGHSIALRRYGWHNQIFQ